MDAAVRIEEILSLSFLQLPVSALGSISIKILNAQDDSRNP